MNLARPSRRHLVLFAAALALPLIWGAISAPASVTLLHLQPAAASAETPAPSVDAHGAGLWPLGVAP